MSSSAEQFNAISDAYLNTTRQLVLSSSENTEKMFQLSLQAAREILGNDDKAVGVAWFGDNLSKVWEEWPAFYQDNAQKALAMAREYVDGASAAQSEIVRFFQDQVAIANQTLIDSIQGFAGTRDTANPEAAPVERKQRKSS